MNFFPIEEFVEKGTSHFSNPKKGEEPVAPLLTEQTKSHQTDELKQILSANYQEMDARQVPNGSSSKPENASLTQAHEVSTILHSLLKEGALRTNIAKLSVFSGEMVKGEASFEQWSYELQTLGKTYSESALREGFKDHWCFLGTIIKNSPFMGV